MTTDNRENSRDFNPEVSTSPVVSEFRRFMRSHTMRFVIVGFITLVLLIPLSQIGFLIEERKTRQDDVIQELKTEWGDEVAYHGLAISVPVSQTTVNSAGKSHTTWHIAYVYPESSSDEISTDVSERYRGIFKANLFTADVHTTAKFNLAAIKLSSTQTTIDWTAAKLLLITGRDTRFRELSDISLNGKKHSIEEQGSADHDDLMFSTTSAINLSAFQNGSFEAKVEAVINGSQLIQVQSLAAKSHLLVRSNWNDPAFAGTSLPNNSSLKITNKGFKAEWNTLAAGNGSRRLHLDNIYLKDHSFSDIQFKSMVDHYQLNERTIKYGILVLTLTFAVFFLIQVVGKVQVHPLHYLMIGLALLLFYSLLLSFSEHVGFMAAYLIAASAIIILIAWYARAVLQSVRFALLTSVSLGLLYAFLLVIVNLEVYALLVGSIGLLVVLAAIMSVTRKLNFDKL